MKILSGGAPPVLLILIEYSRSAFAGLCEALSTMATDVFVKLTETTAAALVTSYSSTSPEVTPDEI